jgi:hypothetical protein
MSHPPDDVASLLYELESRLPALLAAHPSRDAFWDVFETEADAVRDAAGPAREAYVRTELERMLSSRGLIANPFDGPIDPIDVTRDQ